MSNDTNINRIICNTFSQAQTLNKFKTFAKIFRSTIDHNFSSELTDGYRGGMSFEEWASYRVGDDDFNYLEETVKAEFIRLAKAKGIYSEVCPYFGKSN
jgi:hypothetical protein